MKSRSVISYRKLGGYLNKLIELDGASDRRKSKQQMRFKVKECPVIDYDRVYDAVVIVLEDIGSGKAIEITSYSEFFFQREILNLDRNSRLNISKVIVMFLNSIHFDREFYKREFRQKVTRNIGKIEDITLEDGNIFLNDYKYGRVGENKLKSKKSIIAREEVLKRFYYYLCKNNKYKMKYLKTSDFKFEDRTYVGSGRTTTKVVLKSPFRVRYPDENEGERLESVSFYAVTELIILALDYYPMIALAIALQAFTGLRRGEVANVTWNNINMHYIGNELRRFSINLKVKPQLRSDGTNVGEIKSPGVAHVHPAFLEYFNLIFKEHRRYLRETYKKSNKFGAMFMNRYGEAMTDRNYEYAFNILVDMLIKKLNLTGNSTFIGEANTMIEKSFTTHTLRFFFTKYIAKLPDTNVFEVAMFRRDRNLNSAFRYIKENPYIIDNYIKKHQDKSMKKAGLYK